MISKEKKAEIIKEYGLKEGDTGSPEVQVAILSARIAELTEHLLHGPDPVGRVLLAPARVRVLHRVLP